MVFMYEGAMAKGRVNAKFGRVMTADGDNFIGYLTYNPLENAWGAIGKGAWFSNLRLMARGVYVTTDPAGLPFDAATDKSDLEDFVFWEFETFDKENPPRWVTHDLESDCAWTDGSCLYYAYQYGAWGDSPMPAAIAENPYYINNRPAGGDAVETEEEGEFSEWEEPDYGDDFDWEKEEDLDDEAWDDLAVDLDEIDFDEEFADYDFDFEEDFGFYEVDEDRFKRSEEDEDEEGSPAEGDETTPEEGDGTEEYEEYEDLLDNFDEDEWTRPSEDTTKPAFDDEDTDWTTEF